MSCGGRTRRGAATAVPSRAVRPDRPEPACVRPKIAAVPAVGATWRPHARMLRMTPAMRVPFLLPIVTTVVLSLAGGFPGAPVVAYGQSGATAVEDVAAWEALLVDPAGVRLLGHGRSDAGTLVLELGSWVRGFVLLLVGPEGTLERFDGYVGDDGTLLVSSEESDTPTMEALETLL